MNLLSGWFKYANVESIFDNSIEAPEPFVPAIKILGCLNKFKNSALLSGHIPKSKLPAFLETLWVLKMDLIETFDATLFAYSTLMILPFIEILNSFQNYFLIKEID